MDNHLKENRDRLVAMHSLSSDRAKGFLMRTIKDQGTRKTYFLPAERTRMVSGEEADNILHRSFQYIIALLELNLVTLRFHMNHHLVMGFKNAFRKEFICTCVKMAYPISSHLRLLSPRTYSNR